MKPLNIAIIGCGTAGPATAIFLAKQHHNVTVYERAAAPSPIGAGLLIQPTGLWVLDQLGLKNTIIKRGKKITQLLGHNQHGKAILDLKYHDLNNDCFGVGIHRGSLFEALFGEMLKQGVKIKAGHDVESVSQHIGKWQLNIKNKPSVDDYDLVIIANGRQSQTAEKYTQTRSTYKPYKWGAIWGIAPLPQQSPRDVLDQYYSSANIMIGLLPIGSTPQNNASEHASFFWSMPVDQYKTWRSEPLEKWQDKVCRYWPKVESAVRSFQTHDDLTLAHYGNKNIEPVLADGLVVIGDASSAMSPQLGQGANLGLIDAWLLSLALADECTINNATANYAKHRKPIRRFYMQASHLLTPFFQSNNRGIAFLRDIGMPMSARLQFAPQIMLETLTGVRSGWIWSRWNQQQLPIFSS